MATAGGFPGIRIRNGRKKRRVSHHLDMPFLNMCACVSTCRLRFNLYLQTLHSTCHSQRRFGPGQLAFLLPLRLVSPELLVSLFPLPVPLSLTELAGWPVVPQQGGVHAVEPHRRRTGAAAPGQTARLLSAGGLLGGRTGCPRHLPAGGHRVGVGTENRRQSSRAHEGQWFVCDCASPIGI